FREAPEARRVDLLRVDSDQIAGRLADDDLVCRSLREKKLEHLAKVRNVDLEAVISRLGWIVAPEKLDPSVGGDDAVGLDEEDRQHRSLLGASKGQGSIPLPDLQRSKDSKLHRRALIVDPDRLSGNPGTRISRNRRIAGDNVESARGFRTSRKPPGYCRSRSW